VQTSASPAAPASNGSEEAAQPSVRVHCAAPARRPKRSARGGNCIRPASSSPKPNGGHRANLPAYNGRHTFYGAFFVKGVPQGSYPFSRPSVSLFSNRDGQRCATVLLPEVHFPSLTAPQAFPLPRPQDWDAGARRSGQGWRVAPPKALSLRASSTTAHLLGSGLGGDNQDENRFHPD
jgi:hypothetical protein